MQLEILTPDKVVFSGEVSSVSLPGTKGRFQVLENHAALVSSLQQGQVKVRSATGESQFEINGGVVEVLNNKVVVLA